VVENEGKTVAASEIEGAADAKTAAIARGLFFGVKVYNKTT
jgi:hypothetical protein